MSVLTSTHCVSVLFSVKSKIIEKILFDETVLPHVLRMSNESIRHHMFVHFSLYVSFYSGKM